MPDHPTVNEPALADPEGAGGKPTYVVGIGASAGGLHALKTLFGHMPDGGGIAWVVVVHLPPDHESHLPQLLQPHCTLPVEQVTGPVRIEPDHVYVIPPNANLDAIDTHLRLSGLEERRRDRAPIDHFFRTLATEDGHRAVAIVLTGTGSDGARGLEAIREHGGLAIAQDPREAEYPDMPRAAIDTGLADLVLRLEQIPDAVHGWARTQPRLGDDAVAGDTARAPADAELTKIVHSMFDVTRSATGRDFSRYRRSTMLRRIARRMQQLQIEDPRRYLELLRETPAETTALADALLVTVTRFFRDPHVFAYLRQRILPVLFERMAPGQGIRIWSAGCATGEEAYSLAMLVLEAADRWEAPTPRARIFATDVHEPSLERARLGFYAGNLQTDVSRERLERFFVNEHGGYRVRPELRELVYFSRHDVLRDPPFSRIDLLFARNVLIYLEPELQQEVSALLHYALAPRGVLVIGASESAESGYFDEIDREHGVFHKSVSVAHETSHAAVRLARQIVVPSRPHRTGYRPISWGERHHRLVEKYALPSILVDGRDGAVHVSENATAFLAYEGGELSASVFRLVRHELRDELRRGLPAVRKLGAPFRSDTVNVRVNGDDRQVVLHIRAAPDPDNEGLVLVFFEEMERLARPGDEGPAKPLADAEIRNRELELELDLSRRRLEAVIERYESTHEALVAANEELQSSNEELLTTLEELETNKEELQSLNEELETIAEENREKAEALGRMSTDLQSMLRSAEIGTLLLDRQLRIVRFTPRIGDLFNARTEDRGRPLSDLAHRLEYPDLIDDARRVLDDLEPAEREVGDDSGRLYLLRMLPFLSSGSAVDGVVLILVDVTTRRKLEEAEAASRAKSQFLSTISHELRTPLNAVIGYSDLLDSGVLGDLNEKQRRGIDRIVRSANHLLHIIDEILSFSRAEAGKEEVRLRPIDLAEVARSVTDMLATLALENDSEISVRGAEHAFPAVTDRDKVTQILMNLAGNAIKFSEGGKVALEMEERDGWVEVRVSDTGPGIPADRLDDIFEPFVQLDQTVTRSRGGTGLGLAIARRQARLLGGDVRAESRVGVGSTFTLRLPRQTTAIERGAG